MGHRHMRHAALAEEGAFAPCGAVDELVDEHEDGRDGSSSRKEPQAESETSR